MMFCPIIFLLILGIIKEKTFFSCFDFIVTIGIILAITFGLFIELLGCHIIVTENAIEVVSKIFQREDISISDIIDFKESFSLVSNKYPNSLIIRSLNKTVYINLFCYSKKDINNLKKILRREVRF